MSGMLTFDLSNKDEVSDAFWDELLVMGSHFDTLRKDSAFTNNRVSGEASGESAHGDAGELFGIPPSPFVSGARDPFLSDGPLAMGSGSGQVSQQPTSNFDNGPGQYLGVDFDWEGTDLDDIDIFGDHSAGIEVAGSAPAGDFFAGPGMDPGHPVYIPALLPDQMGLAGLNGGMPSPPLGGWPLVDFRQLGDLAAIPLPMMQEQPPLPDCACEGIAHTWGIDEHCIHFVAAQAVPAQQPAWIARAQAAAPVPAVRTRAPAARNRNAGPRRYDFDHACPTVARSTQDQDTINEYFAKHKLGPLHLPTDSAQLFEWVKQDIWRRACISRLIRNDQAVPAHNVLLPLRKARDADMTPLHKFLHDLQRLVAKNRSQLKKRKGGLVGNVARQQ